MSNEKMQEEFERAIAIESGEPITAIFLSRRDDTYATGTLKFAWWAWKFSREVILVDLPEMPKAQRSDEEATFSAGGCDMLRKCAKAIEAAGLKVK